jgi:hypothetical protein
MAKTWAGAKGTQGMDKALSDACGQAADAFKQLSAQCP